MLLLGGMSPLWAGCGMTSSARIYAAPVLSPKWVENHLPVIYPRQGPEMLYGKEAKDAWTFQENLLTFASLRAFGDGTGLSRIITVSPLIDYPGES
ncbi:hypothetical protein [Halomicronema sp. CCY15110]|uniref:hypothetical protein n=1 Tax=Halomicronema sp. CCY15110 TaxID=2767773 RepID=UPI00194FF8AA|nr:hypothetical protein [Halomicronema sp. CCY15110]